MIIEDTDGLTTSFSSKQREAVNRVLNPLVDGVILAINREAQKIKAMDNRPVKTYSSEQPDVFFPYVAQAMLEDFIVFLNKRV